MCVIVPTMFVLHHLGLSLGVAVGAGPQHGADTGGPGAGVRAHPGLGAGGVPGVGGLLRHHLTQHGHHHDDDQCH